MSPYAGGHLTDVTLHYYTYTLALILIYTTGRFHYSVASSSVISVEGNLLSGYPTTLYQEQKTNYTCRPEPLKLFLFLEPFSRLKYFTELHTCF